ncbi:MAG: hypothetical protein ACYTG0_29360 [Planctomycetota bacterium]|jgi:hypothetical protein
MNKGKRVLALIGATLASFLFGGNAIASDWTLEWNWKPASGPWTAEVRLTLPEGDGTVSGQGTWENHNPAYGVFQSGRLLISGTVKDDVLTFTPNFIVDEFRFQGKNIPHHSGDPGLTEGSVSMRVEDGAEAKIVSHAADWVWRLTGGQEQTWRVRLTGQETDDLGGKLMYLKMEGIWRQVTVNYGVRFDYVLAAEFTIEKKKDRWRYKEGHVTQASIKTSSNFDPAVFSIKGIDCKNCADAAALVGQSVMGDVDGKNVRLSWPHFVPQADVDNKITLEFTSKEKTHADYSRNFFASEEFIGRMSEHDLPLLDKKEKEFSQHLKSAADRHRLDKRPPVTLFYRYFLERIR